MNHLHNAIRKSSFQYSYRNTYAGELLPKEVLALWSFGVTMQWSNIEIARYRKRRGMTLKRLTFFELNDNCHKKFLILKEGLHR